jgi:hypothetical protein
VILYLVWRQPDRRWWPVGRLSRTGKDYIFQYIRGARSAQAAGFRSLLSFPDLEEVYASSTLFPLFANRLMPQSRLDYPSYLEWLDLAPGEKDPLVLLARSGGRRATDMFEVFPQPERTIGSGYETTFFLHGLRHRPEGVANETLRLAAGAELCLEPDTSNLVDQAALRVVTCRETHIGFVPRFLCRDISLLREAAPGQARMFVRRVNLPPTPLQFRVLCSFRAPWPDGFRPFAHPDFETLRSTPVAAVA